MAVSASTSPKLSEGDAGLLQRASGAAAALQLLAPEGLDDEILERRKVILHQTKPNKTKTKPNKNQNPTNQIEIKNQRNKDVLFFNRLHPSFLLIFLVLSHHFSCSFFFFFFLHCTGSWDQQVREAEMKRAREATRAREQQERAQQEAQRERDREAERQQRVSQTTRGIRRTKRLHSCVFLTFPLPPWRPPVATEEGAQGGGEGACSRGRGGAGCRVIQTQGASTQEARQADSCCGPGGTTQMK